MLSNRERKGNTVSETEENVESLKQCPGLAPETRKRLIERAQAVVDIYAYRNAVGIWNVWIVDVRLRPEEVAAWFGSSNSLTTY